MSMNRRQFVTTTIATTALLESGGLIGAESISGEKRRIFACGSGILSPPNPLLIQYVLDLTGKKDPVVCLLPTAVGDNPGFIQFWYEVMNGLACRPRHLRLFGNSFGMKSFEAQLMAADVIFVGPGSTLNMLAIWKAQEVDVILKKAWEAGIVMAGESAGYICWFEQGVTDSRPERLTSVNGLGFLKGSACPHYDNERARKPSYHKMLASGEVKGGYACDDSVGLLFEGEQLTRVVAARPGKTAYRVQYDGQAVSEQPLPAQLLEKKS
jgi:peptidase E